MTDIEAAERALELLRDWQFHFSHGREEWGCCSCRRCEPDGHAPGCEVAEILGEHTYPDPGKSELERRSRLTPEQMAREEEERRRRADPLTQTIMLEPQESPLQKLLKHVAAGGKAEE